MVGQNMSQIVNLKGLKPENAFDHNGIKLEIKQKD